jgi:hypothetical protein
MKTENELDEDDVNKSIASLRAVQQAALQKIDELVARLEASRADHGERTRDSEGSDTPR